MQQGRVTVARRSADDVRMRQLVVAIDGEPAGTLLWGESLERELDAGSHRLRVHNTLVWKTIVFALTPGEHAHFRCVNRAGFGTYTMIGLLGVGPLYVAITREP